MAKISWKIQGVGVSMAPVSGDDLIRAGHRLDSSGREIRPGGKYEYSNVDGRPKITTYMTKKESSQ